VAGLETIAPSGLNEHALVLMARILGMTNGHPGLQPKRRGLAYGGLRESMHSDSHLDDYGRRVK